LLASLRSLTDSLGPEAARSTLSSLLREMSLEEQRALMFDWNLWARPNQLPPQGQWRVWLLLSGRGFGKTRTGAEWVRKRVYEGSRRLALVAQTAGDARDVMVEGESGIMSVFPPHETPKYEPSKRRITFHTGAVASTYAGDEPDQLRGPQFDSAWVDELAKYEYPTETWDNLEFTLRLGTDPRCVVTTTPRPISKIKELVVDPRCHVTTGSSYENASNLAPNFIERLQQYEGSRIGRQEVYGEILADVPGALWSLDQIHSLRVREHPDLRRIVVAIDPGAGGQDSATEGINEAGLSETGIIAGGVGVDDEGYVLRDRSGHYLTEEWAETAVGLYRELEADWIVAEKNQGGDMVRAAIHVVDPTIPIRLVTASRGKITRAEPVSLLYIPQRKIHHVGTFAELEDQMTNYDGNPKLPFDRGDALVWCMTALFLAPEMLTHYDPNKHRRQAKRRPG